MLWGLCHAGEKGALNILEMMKKEIDQVFALTGNQFNFTLIIL